MIAEQLGRVLRDRGLKLAVAESCTGGLIGHFITEIPGASEYFLGGIVAYSNDAKIKILGVKEETILKYGAVSEECALEMVKSASRIFNADVAISTTGIAGPGGGTPEKPVGLVYIGIKTPWSLRTNRYIFSGSRSEIKRKIAEQALRDALLSLQK